MKPAWDKLGEEYADSSSVLIGDADCTASGKELCNDNDVKGYPTIKYFDAEGEHKYNGGRDFDALKAFVEENLAASCDIGNPTETCSEREQRYIEKWSGRKDRAAAEVERLTKNLGKKMKADLKKWVGQRINILKQFEE